MRNYLNMEKCGPFTRRQLPAAGKRKRAAFTLIELLVVIAIIAILGALLLPAVTAANNRALAADCISNLHQLATALNTRMLDYGTYPTADGYTGTTSYFGTQTNLVAAIGDALANPTSWFCKRYVRLTDSKPETELAASRIGYFYWGWSVEGASVKPIDITFTEGTWDQQGWNRSLPGVVLLSDRFRDSAYWPYPQDWQFHFGKGTDRSLTQDGSHAALTDGAVLRIAPKQ